MIFRKISRGPLLPIQVLRGEAYNSAALRKNLAQFYVQKAKISRFKFALKSASVVPGCRGHQHTLTAWVHDAIDTYII